MNVNEIFSAFIIHNKAHHHLPNFENKPLKLLTQDDTRRDS